MATSRFGSNGRPRAALVSLVSGGSELSVAIYLEFTSRIGTAVTDYAIQKIFENVAWLSETGLAVCRRTAQLCRA
jgi:hypothetical protein